MLDGVHPRDDAHLAPILAETAVMNRLLDDLRTVSLAEAGALPLHREETDVRRLLAEVAAGHRAAAARGGRRAGVRRPGRRSSSTSIRSGSARSSRTSSSTRSATRRAGGSVRLDARARRDVGRAHGGRHRRGDRPGRPRPRLRPLRPAGGHRRAAAWASRSPATSSRPTAGRSGPRATASRGTDHVPGPAPPPGLSRGTRRGDRRRQSRRRELGLFATCTRRNPLPTLGSAQRPAVPLTPGGATILAGPRRQP